GVVAGTFGGQGRGLDGVAIVADGVVHAARLRQFNDVPAVAQVVAHEIGQVIGHDVDRVRAVGMCVQIVGGAAEVFVLVAVDPMPVDEGDGRNNNERGHRELHLPPMPGTGDSGTQPNGGGNHDPGYET